MSSSTIAAVYAEQLLGLGYGLPLWIPEPTKFGEVLIGDVGFIDGGCFFRLFNAMHRSDHPLNARGVPAGFTPLHVDTTQFRDIHETNRCLSPGTFCSPNMTVQSSMGTSGASATTAAGSSQLYAFSCNGPRGAAIILQDYAQQELFHGNVAFRQYVYQHHASWYDFASHKGHLRRRTDIILVSGWVKATDWALFMFDGAKNPQPFSLTVTLGPSPSGSVEIHTDGAADIVMARRSSFGSDVTSRPSAARDATSPTDQCIFLQYYKLKARHACDREYLSPVPLAAPTPTFCFSWFMSRRGRKGGAKHGAGTYQDSGEAGIVEEDVIADVDPLDSLLDYILAHSSQKVAITNHEELYTSCPPHEWSRACITSSVFERKSPQIFADEFGACLFDDKTSILSSNPGTSTKQPRGSEQRDLRDNTQLLPEAPKLPQPISPLPLDSNRMDTKLDTVEKRGPIFPRTPYAQPSLTHDNPRLSLGGVESAHMKAISDTARTVPAPHGPTALPSPDAYVSSHPVRLLPWQKVSVPETPPNFQKSPSPARRILAVLRNSMRRGKPASSSSDVPSGRRSTRLFGIFGRRKW